MVNIINDARMRTEKSAGIVIPTAMRHNFTPMLEKLSKSMVENKIYPYYFVQSAPLPEGKAGEKLATAAKNMQNDFEGLEVNFAKEEKYPQMGKRLQEGFMRSYNGKTDCTMFICDDFDNLAGQVPGFVNSINEKNLVSVPCWARGSEQYFPYSMLLNEKAISIMITYANKKHDKKIGLPDVSPIMFGRVRENIGKEAAYKEVSQKFEAFIADAKENGTWGQAYFGIMGFHTQIYGELDAKMKETFVKAGKQLHGVGTEVGLPLAAYSLGIKISSYPMLKYYEHSIDAKNGSQEAEKFASSRKAQFEDGAAVILEYAWKNLSERFIALDEFAFAMKHLIEKAPFHFPQKTEKSEWNSQVKAYMMW